MTKDAIPLAVLLIFIVVVAILMARITATANRITAQYEEAMGYED